MESLRVIVKGCPVCEMFQVLMESYKFFFINSFKYPGKVSHNFLIKSIKFSWIVLSFHENFHASKEVSSFREKIVFSLKILSLCFKFIVLRKV